MKVIVMRTSCVFLTKAIKQCLHCNARKSIITVIIFIMFLLSIFSSHNIPTVVHNDLFIKSYRMLQFQSNNSYDNYDNYSKEFFKPVTVTSESKGDSFFISLSYFEQLTCATRNLLSTGGVAQNLGAKVVMPFLLRSRLYGIPDLIPKGEVPDVFYPLHTVYDIDQLNMTFHSLSDTYLVDFEDFLYNAPREIVMVDTIHKRVAPKELSLNVKSITELNRKMRFYAFKIFNCSLIVFKDKQPLLEEIKLMLRISTRRLGVKEFTINQYLCINPSTDVTTDQFKRLIGPEPRTIMFTQWRGCAYHNCDIKMAGSITSSFRHRILYHSNHTKPLPHVKDVALPLSNAIKLTALRYLQKVRIFSPFLSVHIRIEKLFVVNDKINGHMSCCLEILDSLYKLLKMKYLNHTLLITDIGEYGSDSCYGKDSCLPHSRKVKARLNAMGLTPFSFDPDVVYSSKSPAFASLVEMHMLAMGHRLIVVGKGSFKHQIVTHFLGSNPVDKVYHICTEEGTILNEFSQFNRDCWKENQ